MREALKRLSLSKDGDLVMFDNTTANLPGSPETVQEAIDALDGVVDGIAGTQWKEHVKYRVRTIAATPPGSPVTNDVYVDTTNNPDEYYKYDGASWNLIGNVSDGDRVIVLDDTGGTYYQRIFDYNATGDSWAAVAENEDNDTVIVNDDGDGNAAMWAFDTALDTGNGAWFKISDVDWGSPDLQSVYDAGDNTVTMSGGGGNVDWDLHDGGSWEVSTGALYMRVARATAALNWTASVSSLDFDIAGATSITATGGDLTLETVSSGNVNLTSAGNMDISIGGTLDWNDGTNSWAPQQVGLRLANYATGSLPSPPGLTTHYGAVAFDTTLDRPVVWVSDSDGGGTDGWLQVLLTGDGTGGNLDDAYDNFGATAATVTIDDAEGQGSLEWALTPSVGFTIAEFIVSDGTNDFLTVGSTNAGDDYVDIKSIYNNGAGTGTGIDINDNNVQAGGTGGGISMSTTATAGTAGNISLDSEGNVTIEADSASTFNVTGGNLTLSTTTTGDINLTSAAGLTVDLGTNVSWQTSATVWSPEQIGLRLANYATGSLPSPPGVTANYGAIAFDTTRDAPVVWVTDADGGGTDGWVEIITDQYDFSETLDEAYNNFGNTAPVVNIDAAESQTTGLEWRLAADSDTMFVSDGSVPIVTFTRDATAGASDGRVDVGDTAILGLPVKAAAPTAGAAAGDLFYNSGDGLTYEYDGTRSKWLTTSKIGLQFGAKKADGQYLLMGGDAQSSNTGFRMPKDGTIVSVTVQTSGGLATKAMEIRRNGSATPLLSFSMAAGVYTNAAVNVDFTAADYLQVFASATGAKIDDPVALVEIAYRV